MATTKPTTTTTVEAKPVTIFGTLRNFVTTAVPNGGEAVNQALRAVAINSNSLVNLSIAGNVETKAIALDSLKEYHSACTAAGTTPQEVNALLKGYDF